MWLLNSPIGRKVVMAITGIALILFLTFHLCMNLAAFFSGDAYNAICEFLGANWYALIGTAGLGLLVVIHFVFAFWLTIQNRKARGSERYDVTARPAKVEWASQNMLVLGIIVVLGLLLHFFNFWLHMQAQDIIGNESAFNADGFYWMKETFSNPAYVAVYCVWLVALWFHLSHGFWSAFQTIGINGKIWFCRWKVIGIIYATLLILGFILVVLSFAFGCAPSLCCGA
jgi:succinate dehydrogenase / fumarate reductase cytochrome b subunit